MNDLMILVDTGDCEIGTCTKEEAHRSAQLHRAFSVFLYRKIDGKIQMLLQKRAFGKYHSGGLWTNACCSHPRHGESLEEAVPRRMKEEIGAAPEAKELYSFIYYHRFEATCSEFEYDHVFVGEVKDETIVPNPEEIAEIEWVDLNDLEIRIMKDPDLFTPWFMIAIAPVIDAIRKGIV